MNELMRFNEQLDEYPAIKDLLLTKPTLVNVPSVSPPWRVYARKDERSGWGRKEFPTYKAAFDFWKLKRKIWYDVSITSKRQAFPSPGRLVKIRRRGQPLMVKTPTGMRQATKLVPLSPPPAHQWCMYCRRFTIFTWFLNHHAFRGEMKLMMDTAERRCCICGVRETTGAHR